MMKFSEKFTEALLAPEIVNNLPRGRMTDADRTFTDKIIDAVDMSDDLEELHKRFNNLKLVSPSEHCSMYLALIIGVLEKHLGRKAS